VNDAKTKLRGHIFLEADRPKLPFDIVRGIAGPKFENDVDGLHHHGAAIFWVDSVHLQICWDSTHAKADAEPAVGQVV
jgi:hypothetical protein